jgi:hypothetical protein
MNAVWRENREASTHFFACYQWLMPVLVRTGQNRSAHRAFFSPAELYED